MDNDLKGVLAAIIMICSTVIIVALVSTNYHAKKVKYLTDNGYVEVQKIGTTCTMWTKCDCLNPPKIEKE